MSRHCPIDPVRRNGAGRSTFGTSSIEPEEFNEWYDDTDGGGSASVSTSTPTPAAAASNTREASA
jgi:hypothetical protein